MIDEPLCSFHHRLNLFLGEERSHIGRGRFGHASGDVLLGQVAKRLRTVVEETAPAAGKNPLIGRLAGDEFTVATINLVGTNQFEVVFIAKSTGKKTTIRFNAAM